VLEVENQQKKETAMMVSFLALYRGRTFRTARLVATTTDPVMVRVVADHLLCMPEEPSNDPILEALAQGERQALRDMAQQVTPRADGDS
jgi:hypothetical protein